jgi:hypothetical protein
MLIGCGEDLRVRPWPDGLDETTPDETDSGLVDTGSSTDTGDTEDPPQTGPALYPDDVIQSPVTAWVASALRDVATQGGGQRDVFMKIGASSTVSSSTLYCFAGDNVDLDLAYDELEATWLHFLDGDAAGSTPFDRDTEAAISGKTASWAISGDPSPIETEITAIDPSLAVVHYGTNDMGMGTTYESALTPFYEAMAALLDGLMDQGIVPILTGISHRGDRASADLWVESYNAVIRGMAQVRQVPFIDLHLAMDPLADHGLGSDGLHLNGYSEGSCILTPEGLEHGYNMRNLIVLRALDRVQKVLSSSVAALDPAGIGLLGQGSPESPFQILDLPFADGRDTWMSPHRDLADYSGCDSDSDESGPEFTYRFSLDRETAIRAMVLDEGETDIDLHLLDDSVSEAGCLVRAHRTIEGTLPAGDYAFVLDTWVDGDGNELAGEYLFVVQECESDDSDCSNWLD